jgi:ABC-2 type transport system ATP-binding protein
MDDAICIKQLKKNYGRLEALRGIDLKVEQGAFFGLLGPNGAGKTTTINILAGLSNRSSGTVRIFGYDLERAYRECRRLVGLVPQEFNFDQFAMVHKILLFQGGYFGIPRKECMDRAEELMAQFGLLEKRNSPARNLSGGMKRRIMIARALIHRPRLLILDEPTAGVDVDLRRTLWTFLRDINQRGITIMLTTHYIEEAESLCNTIAIIHHGAIVDLDSTRNMADRLSQESIVVTCHQPVDDGVRSALAAFDPHVSRDGYELVLTFNKESVQYDQVLRQLMDTGLAIATLKPVDNRLEQVFLAMTKNATD